MPPGGKQNKDFDRSKTVAPKPTEGFERLAAEQVLGIVTRPVNWEP